MDMQTRDLRQFVGAHRAKLALKVLLMRGCTDMPSACRHRSLTLLMSVSKYLTITNPLPSLLRSKVYSRIGKTHFRFHEPCNIYNQRQTAKRVLLGTTDDAERTRMSQYKRNQKADKESLSCICPIKLCQGNATDLKLLLQNPVELQSNTRSSNL